MNPLDRPLTITKFFSRAADRKREYTLSLRQMAPDILKMNANGATTEEAKAKLPWLKPAKFGDLRTDRDSLRHDKNVVWIDAVAVDYDQNEVTPAEAEGFLELWGLAGMIYTSPSHGPGKERWRLICPLSKSMPPESHYGLVARVNGALDGILAGESFTLSQSFFYGSANSNPLHDVRLVEGRYLDEATELESIAKVPPRVEIPRIALPPGAEPSEIGSATLASACAAFSAPDAAGQRHQVLLAATVAVAPFILSGDLDQADAEAAIREAMGREPNPGELESALEGALAKATPYGPLSDGTEFGPGEKPRARIKVRPNNLTEQINETEAALIAADVGLFQRGTMLVRVGEGTERQRNGNKRPVFRIIDVSETHLRELIGRCADFTRWDARDKAEVPTRCPLDVPAGYLARRAIEWNVRHLAGFVTAPTLRPDGSVLQTPGYDEATGLLLDPRGEVFPAIPETPTRADALTALGLLQDLLSEFPFVGNADRSVALSAILTALIRRSLPTAPMHALTAPAPGTGKTYLLDIVWRIAAGAPASGFDYSADEAENRKQLDAALLEGAPLILLDNVTAEVQGARLNQLLTAERVSVRILGQSRTVDLPCDAFVMANGNNLQVAADLTRRTLLCRIDATCEHPETRTFRQNPITLIQADRGMYVAAALTALRAYVVAGQPDQPKPLGSFERWSGLIRGALLWLGQADPAATIEAVRANDPRRADLLAIIEQWNRVLGGRRINVREVVQEAASYVDFTDALLAVAGAAGTISGKRLGVWLRSNQGKMIGQMKLVSDGTRDGATMWRLDGAAVVTAEMAPISLAAERARRAGSGGDEFSSMLG